MCLPAQAAHTPPPPQPELRFFSCASWLACNGSASWQDFPVLRFTTAKLEDPASTIFVMAGYFGFVVHHYRKSGISCQFVEVVAGFSGSAVHSYDKTVISCHFCLVVAGYSGCVVTSYGKTGESRHLLTDVAGFSSFVVRGYGKTGISCQTYQLVA